MPTYTYTMPYKTKPSIFKNVLLRLEHALVYMGFVVGIILVFENILNLMNGESKSALSLLVLSVVLWMGGYVSRLYFNKEWKNLKLQYSLSQWFRVEFIYFLFSYTFTTLFITIFLRYFPTLSFATRLNEFTLFSQYLSNVFVLNLIFHAILYFIFILGILALSEYMYQMFFIRDKYFNKNKAGIQIVRVALIGVLLAFAFVLINIPFIGNTFGYFYDVLMDFLVTNVGWLLDYAIAFPIFYYLVANYKGSMLAEKFSSYNKK